MGSGLFGAAWPASGASTGGGVVDDGADPAFGDAELFGDLVLGLGPVGFGDGSLPFDAEPCLEVGDGVEGGAEGFGAGDGVGVGGECGEGFEGVWWCGHEWRVSGTRLTGKYRVPDT